MNNWELHSLDVKTAYLNGTIDEEIYMRQPPGYEVQGEEGLVCRLRKGLYGLKQSGRAWNQEIKQKLISFDFKQSKADDCVFVKTLGESIVIIVLYVDDMLIAANNLQALRKTKEDIHHAYDVNDLGEASEFLGMRIVRDRRNKSIFITQPGYTSDVLSRFNMSNAKPVATPLNPAVKLSADMGGGKQGELLDTAKYPYRALIGSVMYLMICTRPDIAAAVGTLSRFMESPRLGHWQAGIHLLRYIHGTQHFGIRYYGEPGEIPKLFGRLGRRHRHKKVNNRIHLHTGQRRYLLEI
jgi:hypothetical protein